jgi:hypothetical protein
VHKHAQQLHISALILSSFVSATHTRSASGSHLLSQLLPSFPGFELDTLDAFKVHKPAHEDDTNWDIALSLPAAASPLPSRSTTRRHHAWGAEGLSDRLRADATIAFEDMFSLGALDVPFTVRLAHDEICVRILPFASIATLPVLAADTSPVLAALVDHAMDEDK